MGHTLEVEPKRAIRPKGKFKVVEHAIVNSIQDRQDGFCQVTGLASGLKVASLVADIVERLPDAAIDPAILSEQS